VSKGEVNFDAFGSAPEPAPAPAPARAASTSAVSNFQDQYEDDEESDDGFDEEEDHGIGELSVQDDDEDEDDDNEYDAIFEPSYGAKLGVLMERVDDVSGGKTQEKAVVKMVVENGAAMRAGVYQGSVLLAVNGESVRGKSYLECLDMIKRSGRPMTLRFRKIDTKEDMTQGECLARVSGGAFSVGNMQKGVAMWNPKYYAFGGPHGDIFQLFSTKQAYHECVIGAYEKKKVNNRIETFNLSKDHRVSKIKHKHYRSHGPLFYFALKVPSLRFVAAKFAHENRRHLENLHEYMRRVLDRKRMQG
jgi:hypothetical protein